MTRRTRTQVWTTMMATLTVALFAAPPAQAACPPLDAACLAEEATGTGQGVVQQATDPLDDTVGETPDPVTDTVGPLVHDTLDEVGRIIGGEEPPPPGRGNGGDGGGGPGPGGEGLGDGKTRDQRNRSLNGRTPIDARLAGATAGPLAGTAEGPDVAVRDPSFGDRFAEALGGAARSLTLVLGLFGMAVGFVTIQDRLDRRDPKLALAPVESDVVEFA